MFRNPNNFDKCLDEATNHYLLEVDWVTILKITDLIRQNDVTPKNAISAIQKKLSSSNSHTAYYALFVLESCVKNCGSLIHDEISKKQFMEQFKEMIKTCPHENVKTKALDLLQSWAFAFRDIQKYRLVNDTVNIMKAEGYKFPMLKESDAMFTADIAPVWEDGDRCHRCRVQFTLMLRKHHCRACGQVFCQQCSSHSSTLPKFGIEKEVRVCESCYEKYKNSSPSITTDMVHVTSHKGKRKSHKSRKSSPSWSKNTLKTGGVSDAIPKTEELPNEYLTSSLAQQNQAPPKKSEAELKEEEELQLALALSQSEAEHKQKSVYRPITRSKSFSPPIIQKANSLENEDRELARYLNRSYWENRATTNSGVDEQQPYERDSKRISMNAAVQNYDVLSMMRSVQADENDVESEGEIEDFVSALRSQVEIFVNRMKSNSSRGRSISNDTSVQSLFLNITAMHSKLLKYIQEQDDKRVYYEGLQDKLTQVKDNRAALDALREEHRERLRIEAEIAERQRQVQMAQKLEIMRQKKQEYLQYQRQLALQRIRDQERELHMRQEQQKQQYRMGAAYNAPSYVVPNQGGVSAFEPTASMGMNMNGLPPVTVSTGPFMPPTYPSHYTQGQNMQPGVPLTQQQMMPPPPPNSFVPGSHPSAANHGPLPSTGQPAAAPPYAVNRGSMIHSTNGLQSQSIHGEQQMLPPGSGNIHMESTGPSSIMGGNVVNRFEPPNTHMMGPPPPGQQQMMQHPGMIRSMMPPSSTPLASPSPSTSSEHSIIQHGPQPVPSAPSATSTPQPEDKEEIGELISFD